MRLLLISLNFVLIEWSLGAPTSGCEIGLQELKEIASTKTALKSSLVAAFLGKICTEKFSSLVFF